jgi:hypothetical protein
LFDGLVFDTDYFRQKMVESRQRKREQRERVRQMLAEIRLIRTVLNRLYASAFPAATARTLISDKRVFYLWPYTTLVGDLAFHSHRFITPKVSQS